MKWSPEVPSNPYHSMILIFIFVILTLNKSLNRAFPPLSILQGKVYLSKLCFRSISRAPTVSGPWALSLKPGKIKNNKLVFWLNRSLKGSYRVGFLTGTKHWNFSSVFVKRSEFSFSSIIKDIVCWLCWFFPPFLCSVPIWQQELEGSHPCALNRMQCLIIILIKFHD